MFPVVQEGPWVFTLDIPSYMPILTHCKNRGLREEFYRAYLTKASSGTIPTLLACQRVPWLISACIDAALCPLALPGLRFGFPTRAPPYLICMMRVQGTSTTPPSSTRS